VVGAIDDITGRSTEPTGPVAEEYLATATAARLVARLGARFRRPGRSRGTVVFGAALGEHHTLAISVVADLVRLEGFTCLELGANVPPNAFAGAASGATRLGRRRAPGGRGDERTSQVPAKIVANRRGRRRSGRLEVFAEGYFATYAHLVGGHGPFKEVRQFLDVLELHEREGVG
jgi:hypothetical protein